VTPVAACAFAPTVADAVVESETAAVVMAVAPTDAAAVDELHRIVVDSSGIRWSSSPSR
jgi:hypothetical protein